MDCNGWGMDVTSHFPVRQDLETLPTVNRTPYVAGDGHLGGTNDSFDISLLGNEDRVPGSKRPFDPAMNMQGAARLEIAAPRG